jgi:hypothetical protein
MGRKSFKPMKCSEVHRALKNLGFTKEKQGATNHEKWRGWRNGVLKKVTVSPHRNEVCAKDVDSIIGQAGVTKDEWAAACDA